MVFSTSSPLSNPLAWVSLGSALLGALVLLWFLFARPVIDLRTKLILFLGILVLPLTAAMTGNVVGYNTTMERRFCSSCHVMEPWTDDSANPDSQTLSAIHARNKWFGDRSCYTCHTNYDMYGTISTKLNGMVHVYHYYLSYLSATPDEALKKIHIYSPFRNQSCMQCHSTTAERWNAVRDHKSAREDVRAERVACASKGCHGPAHPYSKLAKGEVLDVAPNGGPLAPIETSTETEAPTEGVAK